MVTLVSPSLLGGKNGQSSAKFLHWWGMTKNNLEKNNLFILFVLICTTLVTNASIVSHFVSLVLVLMCDCVPPTPTFQLKKGWCETFEQGVIFGSLPHRSTESCSLGSAQQISSLSKVERTF